MPKAEKYVSPRASAKEQIARKLIDVPDVVVAAVIGLLRLVHAQTAEELKAAVDEADANKAAKEERYEAKYRALMATDAEEKPVHKHA